MDGALDELVIGVRVKLKALVPVPKVYVPGLAGLGGVLVSWIATGDFDRQELAVAVGSLWYAAIGWATPEGG